jgi:hypothetical protein
MSCDLINVFCMCSTREQFGLLALNVCEFLCDSYFGFIL